MKKLLTVLLALALVTSLGLSAFATATPHAGKAAIEFESGGLVIEPTNPPEPDHPLFGLGGRSIRFLNYKITGNNMDHTVLVDAGLTSDGTTPLANQHVGVLVNDARGDTAATWTSTVKSEAFTSPTGASLAGYELKLTLFGLPIAGSDPADATPTALPGPHVLTAAAIPATIFTSNTAGSQGKWGLEFEPILTTVGGTEVVGANSTILTWGIELT